jgi:hypothetical protein
MGTSSGWCRCVVSALQQIHQPSLACPRAACVPVAPAVACHTHRYAKPPCIACLLAGRLWTVLLRQLQAHKTMNATRAQRLGRTAALLLLGLVRVEQRQAAAVRLTAAGGPAVHGAVELQVSSQLVSYCSLCLLVGLLG